jgi:hypothetical protein
MGVFVREADTLVGVFQVYQPSGGLKPVANTPDQTCPNAEIENRSPVLSGGPGHDHQGGLRFTVFVCRDDLQLVLPGR